MKKVAFVIMGLGSGGIENYLLRFLNHTNELYEPTVISKGSGEGDLKKEYKKIESLNFFHIPFGYFNLSSFIKLYIFLKKEKFDTICDFTGDFAAFVLLVARIAGVKNRIVFYRNSRYTFKMTIFKQIFLKIQKVILISNTTKVLSNSKLALDIFHPGWKMSRKTNFKIIKNGVPFMSISKVKIAKIKEELNIEFGDKIIGNVSNFRKQKNHTTIVEVAKILIGEYPKVKFLLAGRGVKEGLFQQIKDEGLEQYFIFPGVRDDIPQLLRLLDVFIFPSSIEGQPNALIEAMLYEVPVFASNISTIEDSIPEEVKQNIFSPYDAKAIADAIVLFLKTGKTYNVKKVSDWAKINYNSDFRFGEFFKELI